MSTGLIELMDENDTKKSVEEVETLLRQKSVKDMVSNSSTPIHRFDNGLGQKVAIWIFSRATSGGGYCMQIYCDDGDKRIVNLWVSNKAGLAYALGEEVKKFASTQWKTTTAGVA